MPLPNLLNQRRITLYDPSSQSIKSPALRHEEILTFTVEKQQKSCWCWAAVALGIAKHYDSSITDSQSSIATHFAGIDCNIHGSDKACNTERTLDEPLKHLGHYKKIDGNFLSIQRIRLQLSGNNPIGCCLNWDNADGAHFVALNGLISPVNQQGAPNDNPTFNIVLISDPADGMDYHVTYAHFISGYKTDYDRIGSWAQSYLCKQK